MSTRKSDAQELLAAKLVGRWRSGCPLALRPDKDDEVLATGLGGEQRLRLRERSSRDRLSARLAHPAHEPARRRIPDTLARTHRIVRRGLPYGPPLAPMALRATGRSAAWRSWPSTPASATSSSSCRASGSTTASSPGCRREMSIPSRRRAARRLPFPDPARQRQPRNIFDLPAFVTLKGGGYYFIPSLGALRFIAEQTS